MPFETKKLSSETLSEYLTEVRNALGLTREEVSKQTNIALKFLASLETGKLEALPPEVYVLGFLKGLGELYNVPEQILIDQYRKERGIVAKVNSDSEDSSEQTDKKKRRIIITPKLISIVVGVLFVVATIVYVLFQVVSLNSAPELTISEPQDGGQVSGSTVEVLGKTDPGVTLTINEQSVLVSNSGEFHTTIGVSSGEKDLHFVAINKFGKQTDKTIALALASNTGTGSVAGASKQILNLTLTASKPTTISLTVDDTALPEEILAAGSIKLIQAKSKILVSTSNGGSLSVSLNGQSLGLLGREGEAMTNVPFSAESAALLDSNTPPDTVVQPKNTTK